MIGVIKLRISCEGLNPEENVSIVKRARMDNNGDNVENIANEDTQQQFCDSAMQIEMPIPSSGQIIIHINNSFVVQAPKTKVQTRIHTSIHHTSTSATEVQSQPRKKDRQMDQNNK